MITKNIYCLHDWLKLKDEIIHVDNLVEIKLTNLKRRMQGSNLYEDIQIEWNDARVMNDLGTLFKKLPFFVFGTEEVRVAYKIMDDFIREYYKGTPALQAYLSPADRVPEDIEQTFLSSELRRPFWDLLLKVNQNKMCSCQILEKPIPGVADLDIAVWSGAKVKTPFVTELNENFRTIILRGKLKGIDGFIERYKMSSRKINI